MSGGQQRREDDGHRSESDARRSADAIADKITIDKQAEAGSGEDNGGANPCDHSRTCALRICP
jgi:hypothetical protein